MAKSLDRPGARDKPKRDPAKHSKKDPAKPTRAKAARPDQPPTDPALAELLNPGIGQGTAGPGSQTGLEPPPGQLVRPPRRLFRRAPGAQVDRAGLQRDTTVRLRREGNRACGRGAAGRRRGARPSARLRGRRGVRSGEHGQEQCRQLPWRHRRGRDRQCTREIAARRPAGVQRAAVDAAPPAAAGEVGRWPAAGYPVQLRSEGRPAAGDRRPGGRGQAPRPHPGAARRHRLRQDLHDGEGDRGDAAAGAGARPQQDAGGAALRRVQVVLPRQRGRIFRQLLRLLPARSLRAAHRHLYREGILDQRADRPHAPLGDALAARARRRHHRGLGVVHLRHRLGRDLFGHDLHDQAGRPHRPAGADRRPGGAAVQALGRRLLPRRVPGARRRDRDFPRPLRGPRLAGVAVRRRGRSRSTSSTRSPGKRPTSSNSSRSTPTRTTSRRARPCCRRSPASSRSCAGGSTSSTPPAAS